MSPKPIPTKKATGSRATNAIQILKPMPTSEGRWHRTEKQSHTKDNPPAKNNPATKLREFGRFMGDEVRRNYRRLNFRSRRGNAIAYGAKPRRHPSGPGTALARTRPVMRGTGSRFDNLTEIPPGFATLCRDNELRRGKRKERDDPATAGPEGG